MPGCATLWPRPNVHVEAEMSENQVEKGINP
jgi:hypothetical protein